MFGRALYSTAGRIAKSMPPHRRQAPTFGPNQAASAIGSVTSWLVSSFLAESFFLSSRFFGFAAGAAACDFFADLPYCQSLSISAVRFCWHQLMPSMLPTRVRELRLRATTILQLNLRIRAPFATTIDVGCESKGQA
jgi:hypothetical protein